jgi:hypothetical protein
MFVTPKDLHKTRVNSPISLVANTRLIIAPSPQSNSEEKGNIMIYYLQGSKWNHSLLYYYHYYYMVSKRWQ